MNRAFITKIQNGCQNGNAVMKAPSREVRTRPAREDDLAVWMILKREDDFAPWKIRVTGFA